MSTADRLRLAQILSPAFPVGAFAHSQGLEAAIADQTVTDAEGLFHWLRCVLTHGSGRQDAAFIVAARDDSACLETISDLYRAFLPSAGRDREAREVGQGFATLMAAMGTPVPPGLPVALAVGVATRELKVDTAEVLALWLQGLAAQLVSVAVRFMPLGQAAGQQVLARLGPVIAARASEAAGASLADAWAFAPGADMASMRQEHMETRIFRS